MTTEDENEGPAARIAREGLVLRTRVGSTVHGCGVNDQDDEDHMGICVEPPAHVIGLARFEQHEWRTQPAGVRSGPGDVDSVTYSLRKWTRLAIRGNPSILVPLFVPDDDVLVSSLLGDELRRPETIALLVSRQAAPRFIGYSRSQRARLTTRPDGKGNRGAGRPELVERFGFDTKYAYHMVRLAYQGNELIRTGRLTLPIEGQVRSYLVALRTGGVSLADALRVAETFEAAMQDLLNAGRSPLPERPDLDAVDDWLTRRYVAEWAARGWL